jgi:hypothetical protein
MGQTETFFQSDFFILPSFVTASHEFLVLWHIDPLIGSGPRATMEVLLEAVFVRAEAISLDRSGSVQLVSAVQLSTVE